MMKKNGMLQCLISSILIIISLGFYTLAFAVGGTTTPLPGTAMPETTSKALAIQPSTNPAALAPLPKAKPEAPSSLGEAANKIKFKLNKIIIQGNHVYSQTELASIYKDKIGKMITVAELQGIVQDITNYYRNNGYILSRAVLPPQHVANGIVYIQVIEGYIDHVTVVGLPKGAKSLVQAYGDHISSQRPLQLKNMEHYLLLANEIPGVQVKAVLEPSKSNVGASNLNLVAQTKNFSGYLSYDNYGTRYIGPLQVSAGAEADSIFRAGDSTAVSYVETTWGRNLKFKQILHSTPLGTNGMRLSLSGNLSITMPGLNLKSLLIDGYAATYNGTITYPWIRSRSKNLTLDGGFNYIDSRVTTLRAQNNLYTDHIRSFRFGGSFDNSDSWQGANSAQLHIETGLPILGATPEHLAYSGFTSRFGGSGHFARAEFNLSRLQQFGATRYSAFAIMKYQYAMEPLLASEQFAFGGAQQALGRGYDPAEIIGDRGLAGSLELRMNMSPERYLLQAMQLYVFYDTGAIWNLKNVVNQKRKESATSTGFGSRFYFTKNLTGNLMFTQPLTRQVSALELIGNGRKPRIFFSITASA